MGCDIHSVGQVLKDGKWITKIGRPGGDDRNYDSFAVLANVRNGFGFGGCKTGQGWPVISEPRGLPEDFVQVKDEDSGEVAPSPPWQYNFQEGTKEFEKSVWMGDHSHSWLLLSEIEDFVETVLKNLKYQKTGVVSREQFDDIQSGKLKSPTEWCGMRSGPNVKIISEQDAKNGKPGTDVQMNWFISAMDDGLWTLREYVEELRKIANDEKVSSKEVRLVFGFDS